MKARPRPRLRYGHFESPAAHCASRYGYFEMMDVLVMGNFFIERKGQTAADHGADTEGHASASPREGPNHNGADDIPAEAYLIAGRLAESLRAEQVYLFGSYARGSAGPDSDLDFLVVVPRSDKSRYQRAVEARHALDGAHFPSDVIVLTRAEWEWELRAPCSLSSTVVREGIALYSVS